MADKKETKEKERLLLFTIAYDVEKSSVSFVGNMPAVQAAGLIQEILQSQQIERIRREVEAEMKGTKEGKKKC